MLDLVARSREDRILGTGSIASAISRILRAGIGLRPVGGEFHAVISSSLSARGIVSTSSGSGRCGVRAWFLATSTDRGPLELCLSPSSWSDQGSTNRALHRTPQHRWCRGRAAKTLAVALDLRWLEPIACPLSPMLGDDEQACKPWRHIMVRLDL